MKKTNIIRELKLGLKAGAYSLGLVADLPVKGQEIYIKVNKENVWVSEKCMVKEVKHLYGWIYSVSMENGDRWVLQRAGVDIVNPAIKCLIGKNEAEKGASETNFYGLSPVVAYAMWCSDCKERILTHIEICESYEISDTNLVILTVRMKKEDNRVCHVLVTN